MMHGTMNIKFRTLNKKYLGKFEIWFWGKMEKISRTSGLKN
jgi:hypothetical protein